MVRISVPSGISVPGAGSGPDGRELAVGSPQLGTVVVGPPAPGKVVDGAGEVVAGAPDPLLEQATPRQQTVTSSAP
jgi:hypothetical protein